MIVSIYDDNVTTDGCGCCSESIPIDNKDRIIEELKENWNIIIEVCEDLSIDINEVTGVWIEKTYRSM